MIFQGYLDNSSYPDPEMIIRTWWKKRISNFLPWQSAYSEFYFLEKMWPSFEEKDLEDALNFLNWAWKNFGK